MGDSARRSPNTANMALCWKQCFLALSLSLAFMLLLASASAHGVADENKAFLNQAEGMQLIPFAYLGGKHMVTGYDHLLYLAGVIFFLQRLGDIVKFVSLFAIGHSITLLFGVLAKIHVSPFLVDALVGVSICYKALENLGVLGRWGVSIKPEYAVFAFGLVHGFGLSTKLQDLNLSPDGLLANLISFNIGVELGQFIGVFVIFVVISEIG